MRFALIIRIIVSNRGQLVMLPTVTDVKALSAYAAIATWVMLYTTD